MTEQRERIIKEVLYTSDNALGRHNLLTATVDTALAAAEYLDALDADPKALTTAAAEHRLRAARERMESVE